MTLHRLNERAAKRVAEIVTLARGDRDRSMRLLKAEAERDPRLLRDLVEPFLDGILAHALSTMVGGAGHGRPKISESGMDGLMRGMQRSFTSSAKPTPSPMKPNHADAIRAIAAAQAARHADKS